MLKTQVASLALKMDGLEETLNGISHGDLAGSLATLNGLDNTKLLDTVDAVKGLTSGDLNGAVDAVAGLTNTDLTDAVASLPAVDLLCEQNSELAKQVNLLQGVIGGLGLSSGLEALGLLKIPTLPTALSLEEFGCPAP